MRVAALLLVMMTLPVAAQPTPALPSPRSENAKVVPDEALAAGSLRVRLTYDDLTDPKPPKQVAVTLVGYRADDTVSTVVQNTDDRGTVLFTGLDHTGSVAYYALAELPRKHGSDRLMSNPIVLAETGAHVILSSEARTSDAALLDDLATDKQPKGKLHLVIDGLSDPAKLAVIDAATGKTIANGTAAKGEELVVDVPAHRTVYVDAIALEHHFRSRPFQTIADRGASVTVYVLPRVVATYRFIAVPFDDMVRVDAKITLGNSSWIPYREAQPIAVPLPKGASNISDQTGPTTGVKFTRPLRPGGETALISFDLLGTKGSVAWTMDLPYGAYESSFEISKWPGVAVVPPASNSVVTREVSGEAKLMLEKFTIVPNHPMEMKIALPKPAADVAVQHACRDLEPDRNPLIGKVLPDGKGVAISKLRGNATIVNMTASWNGLSQTELPELERLAKDLPKVSVVVVSSDASDLHTTLRVLADPPSTTPDDNIGVVTRSWGTTILPESFLLDRAGVVRFYFANSREWDSPQMRACVAAVAKS